MNTNQRKIEVLQKAVQMLDNGFNYNWLHTEKCNCGLVASASMGRPIRHEETYDTLFGCWTTTIENQKPNKCTVTGLGISEIQRHLLESGFTADELRELENLSNAKIASRCYFIYHHQSAKYAIKENVLQYLRAWIQILQEQQVTAKVKIVRVAVPVSITEQAKKLLTPETVAQ